MKRLWIGVIAKGALAQCVMCYRTAAAQQAERAHILNQGILILLIPPFLILAGLIWLAWNRKA